MLEMKEAWGLLCMMAVLAGPTVWLMVYLGTLAFRQACNRKLDEENGDGNA